jgi:hypothetical protein
MAEGEHTLTPVEEEQEVENDDLLEKVWETQFEYCDICGHQSYFVVKLSTGKLYFCYHHFNKNKDALYEAAEDVIDESNMLLVR